MTPLNRMVKNANSQSKKQIISVITVCLNSARTIEQTIQSVLLQTYPHIEYIIIDGGSTDGTLEIIRRYESSIQYWISEQDSGIYDAMNKGIDRARGDWIYFLGGDDNVYNNKVIESIFSNRENLDKYDLLYGDIIYGGNRLFKSYFGALLKIKNSIHHQGAFYRRRLFNKFRYNTNLKALSDYELNLRLYLMGAKVFRLNQVVADCSEEGFSGHAKFAIYKDEMIIRKKYFPWYEQIIYNVSPIIRFLYKKIKFFF